MSEPALNTDRELFREDTGDPAGSYYERSVFVTEGGSIGMNVGGRCIVQSVAEWHAAALAALGPVHVAPGPHSARECAKCMGDIYLHYDVARPEIDEHGGV